MSHKSISFFFFISICRYESGSCILYCGIILCQMDKQKCLKMSSSYKGIFTQAQFGPVKSDSGSLAPLVGFVSAGVKTVIVLGCRPKQLLEDLLEETVSVRFKALKQLVCGENMI